MASHHGRGSGREAHHGPTMVAFARQTLLFRFVDSSLALPRLCYLSWFVRIGYLRAFLLVLLIRKASEKSSNHMLGACKLEICKYAQNK